MNRFRRIPEIDMSTPASSPSPSPSSPSLLVRWLRLGMAGFFLWVLYLITPILFESIPPLREFNQIVQETDIMPGALFYTNVPQSSEAYTHNRDALRYFVYQKRKQNQ